MSNLKPFMYGSNSVRTVVIGDQPWFVAKDVCEVLDIGNPSQALSRLDEDERNTIILNEGNRGNPNQTIINEPGLYSLILGSRKPEAKQFKRWITHEVIPSIRKHGAYITPETLERTLQDPDYLIGVITALKNEQETRKQLEQKIEEDKHKTIFADAVQASQDCILVGQLATLLKQNGVNIGQTRLFNYLREQGYLCKSGDRKNLPTQRAMEMKLFEVKEFTVHGNSGIRVRHTPKVTGRGQVYFLNKFLNTAS
jgi:anti-repressor protein